mgnify:CR=1 FL=1
MSAVHTVQVGGTQPYAIDIGPGLLGDGTRLAARARGIVLGKLNDIAMSAEFYPRLACTRAGRQ